MIERAERFEQFVLLIDSAHKQVNRIKQEIVPDPRIKSVHTMWLYELLGHPRGITATELAAKAGIDRSLVSREIRTLEKYGYIEYSTDGGKSYNSRIKLTKDGREVAKAMAKAALEIQNGASLNIPIDELAVFYSVLQRICGNLSEISKKPEDK